MWLDAVDGWQYFHSSLRNALLDKNVLSGHRWYDVLCSQSTYDVLAPGTADVRSDVHEFGMLLSVCVVPDEWISHVSDLVL